MPLLIVLPLRVLQYVDPSRAVFAVIGQKSDMNHERVITESDGERFASANGLNFIETSAGKFNCAMINICYQYLLMTETFCSHW